MAYKEQVVTVQIEYKVIWDQDAERYEVQATTKQGAVDPKTQAISLAMELDEWEDQK